MISWHRLSRSSTFVWSFWARGQCLAKRCFGRLTMLAYVSTGRGRHLAAATKPSPPKFISKVRFDTVFDILRKFCSFCVFFSIFSIQFCAVRFIERYNWNFVAQNIVRIVRFPLCPPLIQRFAAASSCTSLCRPNLTANKESMWPTISFLPKELLLLAASKAAYNRSFSHFVV